MVNDKLGDRMKEFYENRSKTFLTRRTPVIIRIDGCHFHSFTKGLRKPYDKVFIKAMQRTTQALCEKIQGCKVGYVESDEISLLLTDYDNLQTDAWFDYSVQKVCSVSSSMASMYFNKFFIDEAMKYMKLYQNNIVNGEPSIVGLIPEEDLKAEEKYVGVLATRMELGGYFDARAFNIPESEVVNYFIWRQNDATRNSINSLGYANFSTKELHGLNNSQVQEKLFQEKGINWNDCSTVEKRGTCVIKKEITKDTQTPNGIIPVVRNEWVIDEDIPIFTQDRNYIESVLPEKDPANNNPTY